VIPDVGEEGGVKCVEKDGLPEADDTRLFWVWGKAEAERWWPMYAWHYELRTGRNHSWDDLDGSAIEGVTHYQAIDMPEPGVCPKCGEHVPDVGKEEA